MAGSVKRSKTYAALKAEGVCQVIGLHSIHEHRFHTHGEVGTYIKLEELSIHIGIHNTKAIERHSDDYAEIPIIPEVVFPVLHHI